MILEIDYGNTRLKWRLLDVLSMDCMARGAVTDPEELLLDMREHLRASPVFCRICSVRTAADNSRLACLIYRWFNLESVYAVATQQLAGVVNGYKETAKLGVDRWLAIVAAYVSSRSACVVFDCGTAITVDYIDNKGAHLGGCIAPGQRLMTAALIANAQQLANMDVLVAGVPLACGVSTQSAISCGVSAMVKGFIKEQLLSAEQLLGSEFIVFCTGGDGVLVSAETDTAMLDDDLVFKGLAIACPFVREYS